MHIFEESGKQRDFTAGTAKADDAQVMNSSAHPSAPASPRRKTRIKETSLGDVLRLDLNSMGLMVPDKFLGPVLRKELGVFEKPPGPDSPEAAWAVSQNAALVEEMQKAAGERGGDFRSFAEWTALYGSSYDGSEMRTRRREAFGEGFRSAITTLGIASPYSGLGVALQACAFIARAGCGNFRQYAWGPRCLYDTEFMALAPVVVTEFADVKLLHISGLAAWNEKIEPQFTEDPWKQISMVFDLLQGIVEEAGGGLCDVARLRPFCHTPWNGYITRHEILKRWKALTRPSIMINECACMGNPAKLFLELQAFAIVGAAQGKIEHLPIGGAHEVDDPACSVRLTRSEQIEWLQAGELRPDCASTPDREAREVATKVRKTLESSGMSANDVATVFAYTGHPDGAVALEQALADIVPPETLHIIPARPMQDIRGAQIKAEVTACRARR